MFTDEDIEVVLPGYDKEKLINELFNKYIDIQNAWMNFDYESLMNLCTDELYNSYKAQLEILKLKNSQNIMDDYKLLDSEIKDIIKENNFITIVVYMKITLYDYVINTKNSNVIRGTKRGKLTNNYEMTFRRLYSNDKSSNTCPSCGANIKNINSRICPYCKNIIIKNNEDFVLCKKVNKN